MLDDHLDLEGTFVPDLPRNLTNNWSTTPGMIQVYEQQKFHLVRQNSAAAALARALDYAGILPMLSMKYVQYAIQCYAGDFHNEDLSYLATGEAGTTSHAVISKVPRLNGGAEFIVETKAKGLDEQCKPPTALIHGKYQNQYDIVGKMYGTSVDAYEALLCYPFKYGNFVPCDLCREAVQGLTPS